MCQKNDNGKDDAPCHSVDPAMHLYIPVRVQWQGIQYQLMEAEKNTA